MANFELKNIKGVIPALITPFDEHEEFDENRMRKLVNHLIERGMDGLYLTGSTGEGFLMTPEERKKVVEVVIDELHGRIPVIVHVGAISTKISIDLAKHAYATGADAISSVPPFYWKFKEENIYKYYEAVSMSTPLPMIVYNVPLAGLLGFDFICRLANIPNVKGVKYTACTHQDIYKCKDKISQDFMVYSGADEMAVSGIINEADGIIGSFYSMMPDVFKDIYQKVKSGDIAGAQKKQKIAVDIIEASLKYDYYAVIKESLRWMGVDAGYVRAPFMNLSEEEIKKVKQSFKEIKAHYQVNDIEVLNACD